MDEGSLGVHQVELSVDSSPGFGNGGGVGQHTHGSLGGGHIRALDSGWRLVANTNLETGRTPVDHLDSFLGLNLGDGVLDVSGNNVTTIQQAGGHVLTGSWVTLDHLVARFETRGGDFGNRVGFVVGSALGKHWGVRNQWEMDSWVWNQVGLEFIQIDVQRPVES